VTEPLDDFFAVLDLEIAAATAKSKLKSDRDTAKKRANTVTLPSAVRRRAAEEYHELNALLEAEEWATVSTTALFTEQRCDGCGSTHRTFLQFMEVQQMVKKPSTTRWLRTPKPALGLPREVMVQYATSHICADCCGDHGFSILDAVEVPRIKDQLAMSPTYLQEDINAPSY